MQIKPNFLDALMNVTLYPETNYERKGLYGWRKNKAKQTQPVVSLPALSKVEVSNLIQTRSAAQIPTGELLGIFKPGTNQTQFSVAQDKLSSKERVRELFQLDGPVGVVKELLPAAVALMAQVNMNEHIVFRLARFLDERHSCLAGSSAALFHIAFCAGTNDI